MLLSDKIPLQGNVKNYLGKQKTVKAPLHWKSAPDHPKTKLAYITDEEEKILVDLNLYDSMDGKPNTGPHGIPSLNGGGGGSEGAGTSDSGGSNNDGGYGGFDGTESANNQGFGSTENNTNDSFDGTESLNDQGWGSTENDFNDAFDGTESANDQGWGSTENDFNTGAYDYESAAYGPGKITSTEYSPSFFGYGTVSINQTPGVVSANQYSKATINELMSNPTVKEADKVDLLNRMQAVVNSNLTGAKLSNVKDAEAALFAVDLLSNALVDVKSNPAYDDLTSKIDETAVTFGQTFKDDPLGTLFSHGLTGTVARSAYDAYKNNNALSFMGFTGQIMNKQGTYSSDETNTGGSEGGDSGDSGSNLGTLPLQTGAFQPYTGPSAAIGFFAKNPYNVQTLYNNAKQKITGILQASPSPYGLNAISDSPFYDYLKKFNLNKGIL
jgi:hypothetical protein